MTVCLLVYFRINALEKSMTPLLPALCPITKYLDKMFYHWHAINGEHLDKSLAEKAVSFIIIGGQKLLYPYHACLTEKIFTLEKNKSMQEGKYLKDYKLNHTSNDVFHGEKKKLN